MQEDIVSGFLLEWSEEFGVFLGKKNPLCLAVYNDSKELLFSTFAMRSLFKNEPIKSFINPTFDELLEIESDKTLIFEGFITIGDYSSINTSIFAHVFRKNNKILIVGGVNSSQLLKQNEIMHNLNRDVGNLQRELVKEKANIEKTLNQLNEANLGLKHLNATKDKFFSIIAHDLKNPFNALLGFSDTLSKNVNELKVEEIAEIARIINTVSGRTYALLENLLEWSMIQTGKLIPDFQVVEVKMLVNDVLDMIRSLAASKKIICSAECEEGIFVRADRKMVETVLRNLTVNAVKFTNPSGTICIRANKTKEEIIFVVSDTGIGIDPEFIDHIFDLDCDLSKPGTANEKGTGLGLILCKEFIEKHNGRIWAESVPGQGSDFKFTLPLPKN